jgi:polyisoprenoid-binding protein YceI
MKSAVLACGLVLLCTGFALPAAAAPREVVAAKSEIAFSVKQMGVPVSGRFRRFGGQVQLDTDTLAESSAQISVDIASLTTGDEEADAVALDEPWLDAAGHPRATFTSNAVRALGDDRYEISGELSIRGAPRTVTVPVTLEPQDDGAMLASGELRIRRTDFGIGGGEWNEGELVANEVPVRFRLYLAPAQ